MKNPASKYYLKNRFNNAAKLNEIWERNLKNAIRKAGEKTVQIDDLPLEIVLSEFVQFLTERGFDVLYAQLHTAVPDDPTLIQGHVDLRANEAVAAREWADGRTWRGRKLSARLLGE